MANPNKIRVGQQRRKDKFISKVVNAQLSHSMNAPKQIMKERGEKPSKKWGKMVAKAGRNERYRGKLNKVLTQDYDVGGGSGTMQDPHTGGEMGSLLKYKDPIIVPEKEKRGKTKHRKQDRIVATRF